MGQTVKLRRSAVSGKKPTNAQIELGELSVNTTDGKLFFSKSGSEGPSVEEIITTNAQNTGSIDIVGSITGSFFTGSFIGNGGGLYNIPASGVTGLSLDKISNGSVSASIDTNGLQVNTNTSITGSLTATRFIGNGLGLTEVPIRISGSNSDLVEFDRNSVKLHFDDSTGIKVDFIDPESGIARIYLDGVAAEGGGGVGSTAKLEVSTATSTWTFNHNLGEKYPSITVFDSNDNVILPQNIEAVSDTQLVVSFSSPQTGYITATVGGGLPSFSASYNGRVLTINDDGTAPTWKTGIVSGSEQITLTGISGYNDLDNRLDSIETATGSLNSFTSSINTTIKNKLNSDRVISGSIQVDITGTTNYEQIDGRLDSLETESGSIRTVFNSYTSSNNTLNTNQNNRLTSLETKTGSLDTTNTNQNNRLTSLETKTGSLNSDISTLDGRVDSLELTSGSHNTRISNLEVLEGDFNTYTSSNDGRVDVLETFKDAVDSGIEFTGSNVTIKGNLLVKGTETRVNSTTVEVSDNIISLNGSGAVNGGIEVRDVTSPGVLSGSLIWDSTNNHWKGGTKTNEERLLTNSDLTTLNTSIGLINTLNTTQNGRIDSLETESGSIRSAFNSYTSSNNTTNTNQNSRLTSLESVTGSYLTSYTETQNLQDVTDLGSVTTNSIEARLFVMTDGTPTQFLKADGSIDENTYLTSHPSVVAATSSNNSGRTYIQDILLDSFGHITGITTATETVVNTNNFTTGATWNSGTATLRFTRNNGDAYDVQMLETLSDVTVTGGTYNSGTQTLRLTKSDGNTVDVSGFAVDTDTNWYTTGATFNTTTGVLTIVGKGMTNVTVDLDNRYLTSFTETDPIFTSSPSYGITDTNITNWDEAYGWGDHSTRGYLTTYNNEYTTGATFSTSTGVITFTRNDGDTFTVDIDGRFLTSYTEVDTLATVTSRGATTSTAVTFSGGLRASGGIDGLTLTNGISGTNFNITGVNQLEIADPGEGIVFKAGTSGDITLAIIDDSTDNILNLSGTGASFAINGSTVATQSWVTDRNYLTAHPSVSAATSSNNSGRTYIQDILLDGFGHITGITTATETVTNTDTITRVGVSGGEVTGTITLVGDGATTVNQEGQTITISSTNTTYTAGSGLTLTGTEFTHADTSTQNSVNNSGRTYIQDILLDTYGHITGITSATETVVNTDTNYYTTGVTWNAGTATLRFTRNNGDTYNVQMLETLTDVTVTGGTYNSGTQTLRLTKSDGNTVDVSGFAIDTDVNWYTTGATFNTSNGIITGTHQGGTWTVDIDGRYLELGGGTLTGNLTVGAIGKTSDSVIRVLAEQSYKTGFEAYGNGQGTGYLYVGQSAEYGGGISYNGDGAPAFVNGETADYITFYRREAGTNTEVFAFPYSNNNVYFNGEVHAGGGNSSQWNTAHGWGNHASVGYITGYTETDTLQSVTSRGAITTNTVIFENGLRVGTGDHMTDGRASITFGEGTPTTDSMYIEYDGENLSGVNNAIIIGGGDTPTDYFKVTYGGNVIVSSPAGITHKSIELIPTGGDTAAFKAGYSRFGTLDGGKYSDITMNSWWDGAKWIADDAASVGMLTRLHGTGALSSTAWRWYSAPAAANHSYIERMTLTGDGNLSVIGTVTATGGNSTNWNTAYGWGDHAGRYMLEGLTLTDINTINNGGNRYDPSDNNPTNEHYAVLTYGNRGNVTGQLATHFVTGNLYSRAYNSSWSTWRRYWNDTDFTSTNVSNWNTSYGWGNHASAGYLTSFDITTQTDSKYLRSDIEDTTRGSLIVESDWNNGTYAESFTIYGTFPSMAFRSTNADSGTGGTWLIHMEGDGDLTWYSSTDGPTDNWTKRMELQQGGVLQVNGNTVWHTGNDGSGSGLDADLLDGQQGSYYQPSSTAITTGNIASQAVDYASRAKWIDFPDGPRDLSDRRPNWNNRSVAWDFVTATTVGGAGNYAGVMTFSPWDGTASSTGDSSYQLAFYNITGVNASGIPGLKLRNGIDSTWNDFYTVWHSGNDGSGSGLDADLLDGNQASAFATLTGSNSFSNSYNEFGNGVGSVSNDGNWNGRVNVAGSQHARLDVTSVSDGIITTMYSHTGNNAGKMGTMSNHPLKLMVNGGDKATLDSSGNFTVTGQLTSTNIVVSDSAQFEGTDNPIRIGDGFGSGGSATIHKYRADLYLQYNNGNDTTNLHIGGGGTQADLRLDSGGGAIVMNRDGKTGTAIQLDHVENSTWAFNFRTSTVGNDNDSGFWVNSDGTPDMRLRATDGTVKVLVHSNGSSYFNGGNVGIGVDPALTFHVRGSNEFVRFENTSTAANQYTQLNMRAGNRNGYIWVGNENSTSWAGAGGMNIYTDNGNIDFWSSAVQRVRLTTAGHLIPFASNTYDLGGAGNTWRNIYTGDLHLSNMGQEKGNDVDGTKGNWTFQEGDENLFLINNNNGKKYRINLEEL